MESLNDQNEVINMTYWKTKEDSDANYSQDKTYAAILEKKYLCVMAQLR
jgi:hypothetical protein